MPAAENGSLQTEKEMDRAPIINGMETLPKTKQVISVIIWFIQVPNLFYLWEIYYTLSFLFIKLIKVFVDFPLIT